MTELDFHAFHKELVSLCHKYTIWIAERKDWKERPSANCQFTDLLLRAKIDDKIADIEEVHYRKG